MVEGEGMGDLVYGAGQGWGIHTVYTGDRIPCTLYVHVYIPYMYVRTCIYIQHQKLSVIFALHTICQHNMSPLALEADASVRNTGCMGWQTPGLALVAEFVLTHFNCLFASH